MTFAILRSLHTIIGNAIDDIERVYGLHGYPMTSESTSNRQSPEKSQSSPQSSLPESENSIPRPGHKNSLSTSHAYASPPPSPSMATSTHFIPAPMTAPSSTSLDFPSLDAPCDPTSLSEALTTHPIVTAAISRIIAAAGQLSATVQTPFLSLCDATMGYHLPSCMRMLEASHIVEILREAGPAGLHVDAISEKNGVDAKKLAHILRLLATHHILREVSPDIFTLNRISSLVDSGKTFAQLTDYQSEGRPEMKYRDTNGIAAFVGLCSDEIQKSAAYMTETYYLSPSKQTREGTEPTRAPFCFAFDTVKTQTGFFGWLEGEVDSSSKDKGDADEHEGIETGRGAILPPTFGRLSDPKTPERPYNRSHHERKKPIDHSRTSTDSESTSTVKNDDDSDRNGKKNNSNRFRLERFGKAMSGTDGWEAPGAVLNGFDWHSLPHGSTVVDVGGGIGSTSMLLATAFSSSAGEEDGLGLKFIIQDRRVVCEMGEKAWKAKCPELLESTAEFQVHDFFAPQPIRNAAVFLLRVVLHDWPDDFARKILLHLREAATPETKLLIADFVLPLACPDDMGSSGGLEGIEGAESILAPAPLLPNLGKASANVYWMDLTMQVMFNAQERTLREIVTLAVSAGWKVVKVTKTAGSLFGYIVAVPAPIPVQETVVHESLPSDGFESTRGHSVPTKPKLESQVEYSKSNLKLSAREEERRYRGDMEMIERASSRCGTPTFGSNMRLSSVEEALSRFGGGVIRSRGMARSAPTSAGARAHGPAPKPHLPGLKPALSLSSSTSTVKKKRPSPLSVPPLPLHTSPPSNSLHTPSPPSRRLQSMSPRHEHSHQQSQSQSPAPPPRIITRRMSLANLRTSQSQPGAAPPPPPLPLMRQAPPSPLSPRHPHTPIARRASHAQLSQVASAHASSQHQPQPPAAPSLIPVRATTTAGYGEPPSPNTYSYLLTPRSATLPASPTIQAAAAPRPLQAGPTIARRSSYAQLPQLPLRKRSGTVIGPAASMSMSSLASYSRDHGHGVSMSSSRSSSSISSSASGRISGLSGLSSGGGTMLRFDEGLNQHRRSPSMRSQSPVMLEGGNVLAAAARIERGEFIQRPSSP